MTWKPGFKHERHALTVQQYDALLHQIAFCMCSKIMVFFGIPSAVSLLLSSWLWCISAFVMSTVLLHRWWLVLCGGWRSLAHQQKLLWKWHRVCGRGLTLASVVTSVPSVSTARTGLFWCLHPWVARVLPPALWSTLKLLKSSYPRAGMVPNVLPKHNVQYLSSPERVTHW